MAGNDFYDDNESEKSTNIDQSKNNSTNQGSQNQQPEQKIRVKLPRGRELIGVLDQRLGGKRMSITCTDGKTRNCRVPGRLKRVLWLRPGDIVIIEPWELDNTKGDVLFKYRPNQVSWLKRNGHLEEKSDEF